MKKQLQNFRTWIEIDAGAAKKNYETFRKVIGKEVKLWAVVKSNAYGHGLYAFSQLLDGFGVDGFCVDSVVEGLSLRRAGIKKPILVLGQTLSSRYAEAAQKNITITISSFDALASLGRAKRIPQFHIKIDTGMHRQGFYSEEISRVIKLLAAKKSLAAKLKGIFTHFASAKDLNYPGYTEIQMKKFENVAGLFEKAGFKNLMRHAAATGGTLADPRYHWDAVRVGIGLYGLWPSKELETQLGTKMRLWPVLAWRTVIGEVKQLKAGDYVGYDLAERIPRDTTMAVLPIGYWHGFPRSLSGGAGEVIVNGARCRVLGRVSMDMMVVQLSGKARPGDVVTLIGRSGKDEIFAWEPAQKAGTTHYEFVTRLNPLMERVIIE